MSATELGHGRVFAVQSHSGPNIYVAAVLDNGREVCSCEAGRRGRRCVHLKEDVRDAMLRTDGSRRAQADDAWDSTGATGIPGASMMYDAPAAGAAGRIEPPRARPRLRLVGGQDG